MIQPDDNMLYHPASEAEIIELIGFARQQRLQVRVRGAAQSVSDSVYTDGYTPGIPRNVKGFVNIALDALRQVTINTDTKQVVVQAGCNLGYDPFDPTGTSTATNGLFFQLEGAGLALQNVPDAIHQTVGGYISTGSSAGTTRHNFHDAILAIRLIDGTGTVRVFQRPVPENSNDPFYAVGVSMGLMGIITELTLQCVPRFNVKGQQAIAPVTDAPVDVFGDGTSERPSAQSFFKEAEFGRIMWWPFSTLDRLVIWQAATLSAEQATLPAFTAKPYKDGFPVLAGSETFSQALAGILFSIIGDWPDIVTNVMGNGMEAAALTALVDEAAPVLIPHLMNVYFPLDGSHPPQQFWDSWINTLPMDTKEYNNNLLPALHTELWFDLDQAETVLDTLRQYYSTAYITNANSTNRNMANSCYVLEFLGAAASPFWMSPGYGRASVRINIFWFARNKGNVLQYFQQFWDLFQKKGISFRPHWGYCLPPPQSSEGPDWIKVQYPQWDAFMQLRSQMDPDNIFLTRYWKTQLGIT